ncbi:MAG: limonene-1,2-epoxide hydrolase family protein [Marmoricola sp.]
MNSPEHVVRRFLTLLEQGDAAEAVELLSPDVVWKNTGMPTFRGRKVAAMLLDMERRDVGFRVDLHHVAEAGDIVLTDRTDHLSYGRWVSSFWVCGTFRVTDGLIVLWDDHFSMGNLLAASLKGLVGLVRR